MYACLLEQLMHIVAIQKMSNRPWIRKEKIYFFIDVQSRGEYPGYAKRFLRENGIRACIW